MEAMTSKHRRLTALRKIVQENPVLLGIAAIGFAVSFETITAQARLHGLPGWPQLYPVLIDLGILGFTVESRKAIDDGCSDLVPRLLAWLLAGFTLYVNAHGSARRDWVGISLHVIAPAMWVAFLELTRWRRLRQVRAQRMDRIPRNRWVLAPWPTFVLWRRMVLWQERSLSAALEREQTRRRAIAGLQRDHGRRWRSEADSAVVWQLTHGIGVEDAAKTVSAGQKRTATVAVSPQPAARKGTAGGKKSGESPREAAARIRATEPGLTQKAVAKRVGVDPRTVRRWDADDAAAMVPHVQLVRASAGE